MPFDLPANETHGFWVDTYVPTNAAPGDYRGVFRLTTAGALLLGRIFSPWNIVAYGGGIVVGILLDRLVMTAVARGGRSSVTAGSRRP